MVEDLYMKEQIRYSDVFFIKMKEMSDNQMINIEDILKDH